MTKSNGWRAMNQEHDSTQTMFWATAGSETIMEKKISLKERP